MEGEKANLLRPEAAATKPISILPIDPSESANVSRSFTLSTATTTSSSSSSPPDFLRHIQAAFKRPRPRGNYSQCYTYDASTFLGLFDDIIFSNIFAIRAFVLRFTALKCKFLGFLVTCPINFW